jgi:selenocysteine lyase/cysteine desulfurase
VCVDGVAYVPHRQVDVKHLEVDFYSFSWYKVFGPHIAMLYASWRAMPSMKSLGHFFHPTNTLEGMLGLAGGSYELVQSIPHVLNYLTDWRRQAIEKQEAALVTTLLDYLEREATVYGKSRAELENPMAERLSTISFSVPGWSPRALVEKLEEKSMFGLKWGDFYCPRLTRDVLGCGPEGVVRVSLLHYNTSMFSHLLFSGISVF